MELQGPQTKANLFPVKDRSKTVRRVRLAVATRDNIDAAATGLDLGKLFRQFRMDRNLKRLFPMLFLRTVSRGYLRKLKQTDEVEEQQNDERRVTKDAERPV